MSFLTAGNKILRAGTQLLRISGLFTVYDNFNSYTDGSLSDTTNWENSSTMHSIEIIDDSGNKVIQSGETFGEKNCIRIENFSNNQFSQLQIVNATLGGDMGVSVRGGYDSASDNFYHIGYYGYSEHRAVFYSIGGSWVMLAEYTAASNSLVNGDTLRLEVQGNELRAYYNGNLDASLEGSSGGQIDITSLITSFPYFSSGKPGVCTAYGLNTADNWSGGDL